VSLPLDDLYREIILDHYKQPRNRGELDPHTARVEGNNPLCGDEIQLDVRLKDGELEDLAFQGRGCSISQASASMMTEAVKARRLDDVQHLIDSFKGMMHGQEVVQKFPVRIKCALLAWTTLEEALKEASS